MKIKRVVIPTLTLLLVASQLCGCAATSQNEMLQMLERQEAIVIEIPEPISQEQGTEIPIEWKELASLTTYQDYRNIFDDTLGITAHGTNGKNGSVYVDLEGNHTNNSTLRYAFANQKFIDKCWDNTDTIKVLSDAAQSTYADVGTTKAAMLAGINAYFNLLADAEPSYANLNSTLTRLEAMSLIFKADTPVQELQSNVEFANAVGNHELAIYAQGVADQSFLDYSNLSLDEKLADSTITRAEFIYMLIQRYYSEEYATVTGKETCYTDAKNGGDIAGKQKFVTTDKETGAVNAPNRWQAYELSYALQNPDKGLPDDLYKALVVAKNHNIISGTESRWDEGLSKGESLNLIITVYEDLGTITNADRGASEGENLIVNDETSENTKVEDYTIEEMDAVMYGLETVPTFAGPSKEDFAEYAYIWKGEAVTVTGIIKSYKGEDGLWYQLSTGGFVSAEYLTTEQPEVNELINGNQSTETTEQGENPLADMSDEDIQSALEEAMNGSSNSYNSNDRSDWVDNGDGTFTKPDGTIFYGSVDELGGDAPDGVSGW